MSLKANTFSIIASLFCLYITKPVFPSQKSPYSYKTQPSIITSIIKKEKNIKNIKNIILILNQIDNTYGNLYNNLVDNKKLTIFFDPAH